MIASGLYIPSMAEIAAVSEARGTNSAAPRQWRNLVAMWRPSAGIQGTRLIDWSGNANHGDWVGTGTRWVPGPGGRCARFNGIDDHVDIPDKPSLSLGVGNTPVSVTLWMRSTMTINSWRRIISKGDQGTTYGFLLMHHGANDKVGWGDQAGFVEYGADWNDGTWRHIAATYNGSVDETGYAIYVNGVQVSVTEVGTANGMAATTQKLCIGGEYDDGVFENIWLGDLNDIRLYSSALTPTEVMDIYRDPFAAVRFAHERRHWFRKGVIPLPSGIPCLATLQSNVTGL